MTGSTIGRTQKPRNVEGLTLDPTLESRCGDEIVEAHRQPHPILLGEERVDIERAESTYRWILNREDQVCEIEVATLDPTTTFFPGERLWALLTPDVISTDAVPLRGYSWEFVVQVPLPTGGTFLDGGSFASGTGQR